MKLPRHLDPVAALQSAGVPVRIVSHGKPVPCVPRGQPVGLVMIGDDRIDRPSVGPDGFDGPALRSLLAGLDPGMLGLFSGAPIPEAYAAMCLGAAQLAGGAVIVECTAGTFGAWLAYTWRWAPRATRIDVAPEDFVPPFAQAAA